MKLSNNFSFKLVIAISIVFYNYSVLVSAVPQWVWNPDANSVPPSGGNNVIFGSQTSAADSTKDKVSSIKIVDTQARLFPSIVSAISNSINNGNNNNGGSGSGGSVTNPFPGGGSGGSGGGGNSCNPPNSGACIGSQIAQVAIENGINAGSAVAQNPSVSGIFGSILQNIFGNGASTLPAGIGGSGSGGNKDPGSGSGSSGTGSCSCVDASSCFLPSKPAGTCDGGRTNCCQSTRGTRGGLVFPDEGNGGSSSTKSVTRSQIRRALFKNIVRGSGSLIDDTLDLVLHRFLTEEDQKKVATRVLADD